MRWISAIGGVIATGAAIAVLMSLPTEMPASDAASELIEETNSTEQPVEQVVFEEQANPDLSVSDLGDAVTDVLAENGYTQFVADSDLPETLSDEVLQVLISEDAVLVIPSEEGG